MKPWLSSKSDEFLFYKYLDNCSVYFEYGSGGSTYQASIRPNIKKIYSVESDKDWHDKLKGIIKNNNIRYMYNELFTKPNTWGYPGEGCREEQKINYSNQIFNLSLKEQKEIDLVVIDGRFRVACCLKLFNIISKDSFILFDDFPRKEYHIVLDYFNIIEKSTRQNLFVLQQKKDVSNIPIEVIKKYETISK